MRPEAWGEWSMKWLLWKKLWVTVEAGRHLGPAHDTDATETQATTISPRLGG